MWFEIRDPENFRKAVKSGEMGHDEGFWRKRNIHVDCRGPLIVHSTSEWGVGIVTLTASHRPEDIVLDRRMVDPPTEFERIYRSVVVEEHAWIGSFSILYNCRIGHHSVVSVGSVVASMEVPAWVIVAGNPAQIIAEFYADIGKFVYYSNPRFLERKI